MNRTLIYVLVCQVLSFEAKIKKHDIVCTAARTFFACWRQHSGEGTQVWWRVEQGPVSIEVFPNELLKFTPQYNFEIGLYGTARNISRIRWRKFCHPIQEETGATAVVMHEACILGKAIKRSSIVHLDRRCGCVVKSFASKDVAGYCYRNLANNHSGSLLEDS